MSNLIFESLKSARNKYKGKIDIHIFDRFIREDRSNTYKYVEKMCELYIKNNIDYITVINIFRDYQDLEKYITGKDLTNMSLDDILNTIDEAIIKKNLSNRIKRNRERSEFLIYDKDNVKVYLINSFDAAKSKGKSTQWCISLNKTEFEHYRDCYDIFFIENKNYDIDDKFRKICYLKNNETEMIVDKNNVHYFDDYKEFKHLKEILIPNDI